MTATETAPPRKLAPEVRRSLARVKNRTASETDLQRVVIAYAKDHGWLVDHRARGRTRDGTWLTIVWGHPGWPDVAMVRDDRLVLVELKAEDGAVSPEQQVWHNRLERVPGIEFYVWRPRDWTATIRPVLR